MVLTILKFELSIIKLVLPRLKLVLPRKKLELPRLKLTVLGGGGGGSQYASVHYDIPVVDFLCKYNMKLVTDKKSSWYRDIIVKISRNKKK